MYSEQLRIKYFREYFLERSLIVFEDKTFDLKSIFELLEQVVYRSKNFENISRHWNDR